MVNFMEWLTGLHHKPAGVNRVTGIFLFDYDKTFDSYRLLIF